MALEQVGWEEAELKGLQAALVNVNSTQNRHDDELTLMLINSLCSKNYFSKISAL